MGPFTTAAMLTRPAVTGAINGNLSGLSAIECEQNRTFPVSQRAQEWLKFVSTHRMEVLVTIMKS